MVQKTTPDATTFKNKETGKVIVAVRGTDITNISDLAHDIAIVTGVSRFTPRIKSVTEVVQYAIDTYGKENVTLRRTRLQANTLDRWQINLIYLHMYLIVLQVY